MPDGDRTPTAHKRPVAFHGLCLGLFGVGVVNLGVAVRGVQSGADYAALGISFIFPLQVLAGLAWGVGFLWAAWRLWRLRGGAVRQATLTVGAYGLFQVIWWRVFARSDYALGRWPFALLITALLVALVVWYLTRPPVRALFRADKSGTSLTQS
jgi:hypothetical protein